MFKELRVVLNAASVVDEGLELQQSLKFLLLAKLVLQGAARGLLLQKGIAVSVEHDLVQVGLLLVARTRFDFKRAGLRLGARRGKRRQYLKFEVLEGFGSHALPQTADLRPGFHGHLESLPRHKVSSVGAAQRNSNRLRVGCVRMPAPEADRPEEQWL